MKTFKKLIILILTLITNISFVGAVDKEGYKINLTGPVGIDANAEFNINVVAKINDGIHLNNITHNLKYDSSKITLVKSVGQNGFTIISSDNKLTASNTTNKSGEVTVAVLTFKATENFKLSERTTISLENGSGSNGEDNINGSGFTFTITVTKAKSENNYLKSLSFDFGKIEFKKNTLEYSFEVENEVDTIKIIAQAEDVKSSISGMGTRTLESGENKLEVICKAENGSARTYIIKVTRKSALSSNNSLASLKIEGYEINFESEKLDYDLEIENNIENLEIIAIATDSNATINIDKPAEYKEGLNKIKITIIAENGEEKIYSINVNKKSLPQEEKPTNENLFIIVIALGVSAITVTLFVLAPKIFYKLRRK